MDLFQRRAYVGVRQRHTRNHQIELLLRVGESLRSATDETHTVCERAAEAEGLQINVDAEAQPVRVRGSEGLPRPASEVQHPVRERHSRR